MRILFFGMPVTSAPYLRALLSNDSQHEVVGVVMPTISKWIGIHNSWFWLRKAWSSHQAASPKPYNITWLARSRHLPIWHQKLDSPEFVHFVANIQPDLFVVATFNRLLNAKVLSLSPMGVINVHPSLLPKYRGADPIFWAIMNEEHKTGVTIHKVDIGMDSGPILSQRSIEVDPNWDAIRLGRALDKVGVNLLLETLDRLESGGISTIQQDERDATYFPPADVQFRTIDWTYSSIQILRMVKASTSVGGAHAEVDNQEVTVHKAEVFSYDKDRQLEMLSDPITDGEAFVACKDAILRVKLRNQSTLSKIRYFLKSNESRLY